MSPISGFPLSGHIERLYLHAQVSWSGMCPFKGKILNRQYTLASTVPPCSSDYGGAHFQQHSHRMVSIHQPRPPSHPRKWPELVGISVNKKQPFLLLSHWDMRIVCYHSRTYPILISITQSGILRPIYPQVNLSKQNTLDWYLVEKSWWPHSSLAKNISSSCSGTVSVSRWQWNTLKPFLGLGRLWGYNSEEIILRIKWDNPCQSVVFTVQNYKNRNPTKLALLDYTYSNIASSAICWMFFLFWYLK